MCDPVTLLAASAALTGGGALANNVAQGQVNRARASATNAETARQRRLRDEASEVSDQSRNRFAGAEGQREERARNVADFYGETSEAATRAPDSGPVLPASTSAVTVAEQGRRGAEDRAFSSQQNRAAADMRSFGDFLANAGFGVQRDVGLTQQLGGFGRGSAAVLPFELEAANQRGAGLRMLGDILGGAGRVAGGAAIAGGALSAFGAPATAQGAINPMTGVYTPLEGGLVGGW